MTGSKDKTILFMFLGAIVFLLGRLMRALFQVRSDLMDDIEDVRMKLDAPVTLYAVRDNGVVSVDADSLRSTHFS